MGGTSLQLDYANVLSSAVGPAHGLTLAEIRRAEPAVKAVVARIERERKAGQHRYRELPGDRDMLKAVKAAVRRFKPRAENLAVLGIGGSALGANALHTALSAPFHGLLSDRRRRGPRLFVMDNVDPVLFGSLLDLVASGLERTVFNVVSKSGETAETAAQFLIIRDLLTRKLGAKRVARSLVVTTDPQTGTLRELADREKWYTLPVPPGVGGRFSVLSAVGLFPAAMCGINIDQLLAGAATMGRRVGSRVVRKNPAAMLALLLHGFYTRGKRIHVLFPYSNQLKDLADWYRQLWAESLGKQHDLEGRPVIIGPTPIKALGATDQHSQVQLYREGPNDKVFIFLEVTSHGRDVRIPRGRATPDALKYLEGGSLARLLNAERRATEFALVASRRPCLNIRFPRVNGETVGQFIMLWEAAASIMGRLLNVNPYDQPAVQLGKDYTYALMGKPGYEKQARQLERRAGGRDRYVV
jgi:glucose-6-phosphate isomerase